MDPVLTFILGAIFVGFPLGVITDRAASWLAHRWTVRLRSHVSGR